MRVVVLTGAAAGSRRGGPQVGRLGAPRRGPDPAHLCVAFDGVARRCDPAIRRLHQPVIAAVNGAAIGGGLCLSLAADIRVAADGAYQRAAGINNGLTASELGLSYLLPRAIGSPAPSK